MSALAEHRPDSDHILDGRSAHGPASLAARLRADFGAHLEADYPRLVAQLYAITLDAGEAHDAVQDAYSRAWRDWAVIRRSHDPAAWVRSVAVRSTIWSWRRMFARTGIGTHRSVGAGTDPRSGALLSTLGRLPAAERRAVVLFHMAGVSLGEIAAIERTSADAVAARLAHGRHVVTGGMADVLPDAHVTDAVLGLEGYAAGSSDAPDYLPAGYGAHADYPVGYEPPGGYLSDDALDSYRREVHYPERYDLGLADLDDHGSADTDPDGRHSDRSAAHGVLAGPDSREHR